MHSSPLLVGQAPIGALNLYATTAGAFTPDSRAAAAQLTALAAATVTAAMRHYDQTTLTDHLRAALSSRSVIDQAIGIIIGMQRCPPQTAFDILRTVSQNRNIPLRDVAAELVATTITPTHPTSTRLTPPGKASVGGDHAPSDHRARAVTIRRQVVMLGAGWNRSRPDHVGCPRPGRIHSRRRSPAPPPRMRIRPTMLPHRPDHAPSIPLFRFPDHGRIHRPARIDPRPAPPPVASDRPFRVGPVRLGRVQDPR